MNEAGRYSSRLNFVLAQTKIELQQVDAEINRLNNLRETMLERESEALYSIHSAFPQFAQIRDRYART